MDYTPKIVGTTGTGGTLVATGSGEMALILPIVIGTLIILAALTLRGTFRRNKNIGE